MTVPGSWVVILDPPALASGQPANRTPLNLNSGGIRIDQKGIDWGDAQIQSYLADRRVGSVKIDFRMPNRKVTIPLFLGADETGDEETWRSYLTQKVGILQGEGGFLQRQRLGGLPMYADVIDAVLTLPDTWGETGLVEPNVNLILECSPDFYGDEITLDPLTATGVMDAVVTEFGTPTIAILGDWPGRARIVVTDMSGNQQNSILWAFRSRHYDSDVGAKLVYQGGDLTPISPTILSSSGIGSWPGFSGPYLDMDPVPKKVWTPFCSTTLVSGSLPMTHRGSYRVYARCGTASWTSSILVRLVWGVGAAIGAIANDAVQMSTSNMLVVDLGEIRIDDMMTGSHRWEGQIQVQAIDDVDPHEFFLDQLYFVPLDECAGAAVRSTNVLALNESTALDSFNETSGNLTGKTADVGGNWSGSGSSSDWTVDTADSATTRSHASDTSNTWSNFLTHGYFSTGGRFVLLGPSAGNVLLSVDLAYGTGATLPFVSPMVTSPTPSVGPGQLGLVLRYFDASNWFMVVFGPEVDQSTAVSQFVKQIHFVKNVAGVITRVGGGKNPAASWPNSTDGSLLHFLNWQVSIESGLVRVYLNGHNQGIGFIDEDLLSTGALASGKCGLYHVNPNSDTWQVWADSFAVSVPTADQGIDAVMFANASAELRYDRMLRFDPTNTYPGPISQQIGDLARIPISGVESRNVELFVKPSRGDLTTTGLPVDQGGDIGVDAFKAQIIYRPCFIGRT